MDSRWKNLLVLVVAIAVIAGVFLVLQSAPVESSSAGLASFWSDEGVDILNLNETELGNLASLSEQQLSSIALKTTSFKNQTSDAALKSQASVYLSLANYLMESKKVAQVEGQLASLGFGDICSQVPLLNERNSLEAKRLNALEQLAASVEQFSASYPGESEKAGIESIGLSLSGLKADLETSTVAVAELEGLC